MPKTCCFLTSIFSGFGLDFGGSWTSKSAALLAAPGVLEPTAFYACINILHFLTRGGPGVPRPCRKFFKLGPCWLVFRSWAPFFRSWPHLARLLGVVYACWAFFSSFGSLRVGSWCAQGQFLRVQNLIFRCFVARAGLQCENIAHVLKPQFFLGFCMVFTHCTLCAPATKRRESVAGGCRS